jgi:hypothetical protein
MNKGELSEVFTKITILLGEQISTVTKSLAKDDGRQIQFINLDLVDATKKIRSFPCGSDEYELVKGSLDPSDTVTSAELRMAKADIAGVLKGESSAISGRSKEILARLNVEPTASSSTADLTGTLLTMDGERNLGFSVKSFFAGNPTLFNATTKGSRFRFHLESESGSIDFAALSKKIENVKPFVKKFQIIKDEGFVAISQGAVNEKFRESLSILGANFDVLLGELLYSAMANKNREVLASLARVSKIKAQEESSGGLDYQIRNFLKGAAFGWTASKPWTGKFSLYGGYLIVFKDLTVGNLGAQNLDEFGDYLLENTYFEAPSTKRHDYGYIFEDNGRIAIDLQLQVRFTSALV